MTEAKTEPYLGGQEKNAHALNIWRRVKLKLEGKVPDSSKKSTVAEQVNP